MLDTLKSCSLIYLASPYSRYRAGLGQAYRDVSALAGKLMGQGIKVISPIAHSHSIAEYSRLKHLDYAVWMPLNEELMQRCDALLIAEMVGWKDSIGVQHEIRRFRDMGRPIYRIHPDSLEVRVHG